jgi:hypothetical protein
MRYLVHRAVLAMASVAIVLGMFGSARPVTAAPEVGPSLRYFSETGHNISGGIKAFYEAHGDVAIFGLPLTEVVVENGLEVQYFERARFELHPELPSAYYVSLTHLGRQLTRGRTDQAFRPAAPGGGAFFKETSHNVSGAFLQFWNRRGGLPVFGLPIS